MRPENSQETTRETVLLTGATRGLGLAIARRLVDEGYFVAGVARKSTAEFDDVVEQGNAAFFGYDLADTEGIPQLVKRVTEFRGRLFALVNNAGIGLDGLLATMHARDIERLITVNLLSPIHLAKYASRQMMLRRHGRIINISSIIATTGFSGLAVYAATKSGLEGLARSLARELGRANITVNSVAPGYMETEMTSSLDGDKLESVRRRAPLGLATVNDVAGAVVYLLGRDGDRVTGATITVDGGSTA